MAVQSVSAWPEKRGEIKKMMEMAAKDIERLGGTVEMVDVGKQKVSLLSFHLLSTPGDSAFCFVMPLLCIHPNNSRCPSSF